MCYRKPGPRCSHHARKKLADAKLSYKAEKTYENYEQMMEAQDEFDATKAGQQALAAVISIQPNPEKKFLLQGRLEKAENRRKDALAAIKSKDRGDNVGFSEHTHTKSGEVLTTSAFADMTEDSRWNGFGYLGEREGVGRQRDPEVLESADKQLLDRMNYLGYSYEQAFEWMNSKKGRYYGDAAFGSSLNPDESDAESLLPTE